MNALNRKFRSEFRSEAKASGSSSLWSRIGDRFGEAPPEEPSAPVNIRDNEALELLRNYEETGLGWFWSTNEQGHITYITNTFAKALGMSANDLLGQPILDLFARDATEENAQRSLRFLFTKRTQFVELNVRSALEDKELWWAISGIPQFDKERNFKGYRGVGTDITEQRRTSADTERLALCDPLTGLANRAAISHELEMTLAAYQTQKRSCSIMLLDLDRFKVVNDSLGHPAGDELLKQVASRLQHVVGDAGKIARIGGDEFQVLLPTWSDKAALASLADEIIKVVSHPYSIEEGRCIIGTSIGIAISPFDGDSSKKLIKNADIALYAAKSAGKGQHFFFTAELEDLAEQRRILEQDLGDAIANDELELVYQPIIDVHSSSVSGFEALMRWHHPERGDISPGVFIPIAEETNLIVPLGQWALREACLVAQSWPEGIRVSVNVSPVQFADEDFAENLKEILVDTNFQPDRLEIEVTESVFLDESSISDQIFADIKQLGVRLALDDFGTGYSSLSYLQNSPFDKIKVDQSFVRGARKAGSNSEAIIAAIVALSNALGATTTAEGVETIDELEWIKSLNVDQVQGHVFSKPLKAKEIEGKFNDGQWFAQPSGPKSQRADRISMFRRVTLMHEGTEFTGVIRNISETGALVDGLDDVPIGTEFKLDFGHRKTAICTVRRATKSQIGVEFKEPLIRDGDGGYCPRRGPTNKSGKKRLLRTN